MPTDVLQAEFPTPLTNLLGIRVPIIQAPIGSFSCPELAAAVSEAGGLGMLALSWDSVSGCREKIGATQTATKAPFGVNLVLEWDQTDRLKACLDAGVTVVSFFWGDASRYIPIAQKERAKTIVIVGSSEEARKAVDAGADAIVCQGYEAGGHVRGIAGSVALIPAVVDTVGPIPVIAAGGFADGRGLAAALSLGASGVWMGTRFSASTESRAHLEFKKRLVEAGESDTEYLSLFDGGWPNAPHRVLRNSTVRSWKDAGHPNSGMRPDENEVIGRSASGNAILRYDDTPPVAGMQGNWEACALYAGEGAGIIYEVKPARSIVDEVVCQARETIHRLAQFNLQPFEPLASAESSC
jgi:nitronate monooxygenase